MSGETVLIVDDEASVRELLEIVLSTEPYRLIFADSADAAIEHMREQAPDLVLTDLYMYNDRRAGFRVLSWVRENCPWTPVLMITAHGTVDTAIEAMREGAVDFILKPFPGNDEIRIRVRRALQELSLQREVAALRWALRQRLNLDDMVGSSPKFLAVQDLIGRVAALPSTVAIYGESGVGKELVARALHEHSPRARKPFVAINCGGIPETLLESELFGYRKGAFTGAVEDKDGLFVVAHGGTVFLDEIGEMPMLLQVKLLRVLDTGMVMPVGGTAPIKVDVRLISATNRDLAAMVEQGLFRKDLYYRLNVIPIHVPPLRERREDILPLVEHFMRRGAARLGCAPKRLTAAAERMLREYDWPGNVRELANVVERALALARGPEVDVSDLMLPAPGGKVSTPEFHLPPQGIDLEQSVAEMEKTYLRQALERATNSQQRAAELLGLTPRTLRYRLQKYGLLGGEDAGEDTD